MTKLYIICGHGAGDPGAGGGGKTEAATVRDFAKACAKASKDVVVLDTSRNWYASNLVNAALKKKVGSNPVVELHMDSASASAKGGHVIICSGLSADKHDKALAKWLKKEFPGRANTTVARSDLANPKRAKAQGINYRLVELCFITNKADREKLAKNMASLAKSFVGCFGLKATAAKAAAYEIVKDDLWVWDAPKKGSRKLTTLKKGRKMAVTATKTADGNVWAAFTAKGTGKTRWFKIKSADGKKVYAKKC